MYETIFDQKIQQDMDDFFLNHLACHGKIQSFARGEIIKQEDCNSIYILLEGELNQIMHSKEGDEIVFFRIIKGNIFGEMAFFDQHMTYAVNKSLTKGRYAIVNRQFVEAKLAENPKVYHYFLTSIIYKYRAIMSELANAHFNDSTGRLADFLVRLYCTEDSEDKNRISIIFTHEEIANRLGLNRITVTNTMNLFKEKGLIDVENRKIIIKDIESLKRMTNILT